MDDTLLVRRFEGLGDLLGDGEGFVERDRASLDAIRQRWPFDKFENKSASRKPVRSWCGSVGPHTIQTVLPSD